MPLVYGFEEFDRFAAGCVAVGNFDGVHRGHQQIIAQLVQMARAQQTTAVVMTFDPHPIELLRPEKTPPSLSTLQRKTELLLQQGVDCVVAYPTDRALLALTPEQFFQQIITEKLAARGIVEGPNFFFGKNRAGDINTLRSFCIAAGITLQIADPVAIAGDVVSSSRIRQVIAAGEITAALQLLGHPYQLSGKVVQGAQRGRTIGFPTANLEQIETLIPADGVYAGFVTHENLTWPAAINIGTNPTFQDMQHKVEAHLIGYKGDLYGGQLAINLLKKIRDGQQFDSQEELTNQLQKDILQVQTVVEQHQGC